MSKPKPRPGAGGEKTLEAERFSPAGVRLMICGVATLAAGFFVLSFADPLGRNWAGALSPFLILGGYALVGLGVFWGEGEDAPSSAGHPPPRA